MATWYTAVCWEDGAKLVGCSYNREAIFEMAAAAADRLGKKVSITGEKRTDKGVVFESYEVKPE